MPEDDALGRHELRARRWTLKMRGQFRLRQRGNTRTHVFDLRIRPLFDNVLADDV